MGVSASELRLEPETVWRHFLELTTIPRASREEQTVRAYIVDWAGRQGWASDVDGAGNVVVRVPATDGREPAPTVTLQAHLDMVCERDPASPYDPRAGRIHVVRDGDWLAAEGTTLGADNGIGVALAMAAAEATAIRHGPLELLFTVCEEQGLEGAKGLDPALVTGRLLVNLDGTSDGSITVGCAGSTHTSVRLPLDPLPLADGRVLEIELAGGRGGHSGADIHKGRANAITALGRLLSRARAVSPLRLVTLEGGVSRNAIPRAARALVHIPSGAEGAVRAAIASELETLRNEHRGTDDALAVTIAPTRAASAATIDRSARALDLLLALPAGVISYARDLEGVVETSTSLDVARTEDGVLVLASMTRSSSASALDEVVAEIERVGREYGATIEVERSYGPWEPDLRSGLLAATRSAYRRLFEREPRLDVVHGGLECAVLGEKLPGVQMVALGPTILGPHAPGERVSVAGTQRAYALLTTLLDDLSQ